MAETKTLKGISLEDNVVVVFYIHLVLCCVAALTFSYEAWSMIVKWCKRALICVLVSLRKCRTVLKEKCRKKQRIYRRNKVKTSPEN